MPIDAEKIFNNFGTDIEHDDIDLVLSIKNIHGQN